MSKRKKNLKKENYKNARITLKEIYLKYPHKWKDPSSSTIPVPYFPNEEISGSDYALSYKAWKEIVDALIEGYIDILFEGKKLDPQKAMGYFILTKYKNTTTVDYEELKKSGKVTTHKNNHTGGYAPFLLWDNSYKTLAKVSKKSYWRISFTHKVWKKFSTKLLEDSSQIYKLRDRGF